VKERGGCETAELITAYLDAELRPGELDIVADHLAECRVCIYEFHRLKEIRAALRTLPSLEVPERLLPDTHPGEQLSAYLDGQLSTVEHGFVISHLEFCTDCRLELHELDSARTAIRSLPGLEPPESIEVQQERVTRERWSRRRLATAAVGIAAVAALIFSVLGPSPRAADLDITPLFDQHQARVSVEYGINVVPVFSPTEVAP